MFVNAKLTITIKMLLMLIYSPLKCLTDLLNSLGCISVPDVWNSDEDCDDAVLSDDGFSEVSLSDYESQLDDDDVVAWKEISVKKASDVTITTTPVLANLLDQCNREWRAIFQNVSKNCAIFCSMKHTVIAPFSFRFRLNWKLEKEASSCSTIVIRKKSTLNPFIFHSSWRELLSICKNW